MLDRILSLFAQEPEIHVECSEERVQVATIVFVKEAAGAGHYYSRGWRKRYPRLQILTIRELLAGERIDYPPSRRNVTYKAAPREKKAGYWVREPDLSEVETSFAAAAGPGGEFELGAE
jgi:hypothetical protein